MDRRRLGPPGPLGDPQLEEQRRRGRVMLRLRTLDPVVQVRHADRSPEPVEEAGDLAPDHRPAREALASASGSGRPADSTGRSRRGKSRDSPIRFTSSPSTSGSRSRSTGFSSSRAPHASAATSDLGRPRRAWIEGDDPAGRGAPEEEGEVDRELQGVPRLVGQPEVGQGRTRRGTRRYRPAVGPSNSRAQASQAQTSRCVAGSTRCGARPPARRAEARSARADDLGRMNRRIEANAVGAGPRRGARGSSWSRLTRGACGASGGRSGRGHRG